jgi:hypothetical protein
MKTIILLALLILSSVAHSDIFRKNLVVSSTEPDDFKRPLPELLIFNQMGNCIYQTFGFSDENLFFRSLDDVFNTQKTHKKTDKENLVIKIDREGFKKNFLKENPHVKSLPLADQEKIINGVLDKTLGLNTCELKLPDVAGKLVELTNKPFAIGSLPSSDFTIMEYSAEWCVPCKVQEKALVKYFKTRKIHASWLIVERDAQKNPPNVKSSQ